MEFMIEDSLHSELISRFSTREEATRELRRRASVPWDDEPNRAPCTSWTTCERNYEIVEWETSEVPWRQLSRVPALDISATGIQWLSSDQRT